MSLSTGAAHQSANNHHHTELHSHQHLHNHQNSYPNQHQHLLIPQPGMHPPQEELNFSTFMDLCRFCSVKPGQKLNVFDKEAEHRQLLYKVRSVLPAVVIMDSRLHTSQHLIFPLYFQISKDDLLPKKICKLCLTKLEDLIEWRDRAMSTEKLLRNYSESMRVVTSTINFQVNIILFRRGNGCSTFQ